jgi:hypothetical protein
MRALPLTGPIIADLLDSFGIVDDDLPDLIPDDVDWDDPEQAAKALPRVAAKLKGLEN